MKFYLTQCEKFRNLGFKGGNFPDLEVADPSNKKMTRSDAGSKNFDQDPSLR